MNTVLLGDFSSVLCELFLRVKFNVIRRFDTEDRI